MEFEQGIILGIIIVFYIFRLLIFKRIINNIEDENIKKSYVNNYKLSLKLLFLPKILKVSGVTFKWKFIYDILGVLMLILMLINFIAILINDIVVTST